MLNQVSRTEDHLLKLVSITSHLMIESGPHRVSSSSRLVRATCAHRTVSRSARIRHVRHINALNDRKTSSQCVYLYSRQPRQGVFARRKLLHIRSLASCDLQGTKWNSSGRADNAASQTLFVLKSYFRNQWRPQLWGTGASAPLDFQQFYFWLTLE